MSDINYNDGKPHNISAITVQPDPDGVTFTLRVKLSNGGELVMEGPDAIPAFFTISNHCAEQYDDERTIH